MEEWIPESERPYEPNPSHLSLGIHTLRDVGSIPTGATTLRGRGDGTLGGLITHRRWAKRHGIEAKVITQSTPDHRYGSNLITIRLNAANVLCGQDGVHRRCRIAPYDEQKRRHTSFSRVMVHNKSRAIQIQDTKTEVINAKPQGGQQTNNIETALVLTHVGSGVSVRVDGAGRLASKELAAEFLSHKLGSIVDEQSWEWPIISIVEDPYRLVKDHRSGKEEEDVEAYLSGQFEEFMV